MVFGGLLSGELCLIRCSFSLTQSTKHRQTQTRRSTPQLNPVVLVEDYHSLIELGAAVRLGCCTNQTADDVIGSCCDDRKQHIQYEERQDRFRSHA